MSNLSMAVLLPQKTSNQDQLVIYKTVISKLFYSIEQISVLMNTKDIYCDSSALSLGSWN